MRRPATLETESDFRAPSLDWGTFLPPLPPVVTDEGRITEAGDLRITEAGDVRIPE